MGRGRKKEKRSKLAGERLKIAKTIFGSTYENFIDDLRWKKIVGITDSKSIRAWIKNGLPLRRVGDIASYFGVEGHIFTDPGLNSIEFEKKIYSGKYRIDRWSEGKTVTSGDGDNADQFNWNDLAAEMRMLECSPIYSDKGYTLKDIFIFQNAEFKLRKSSRWEDIGNLKDYLLDFDFAELKLEKKPVIIYGDFGIGKSSFLKMLASLMVKSNHRYFPILVPLRELPIYDPHNLVDAIKKFLAVYGNIDITRLNRKVLFLLDGFDELNFYMDKDDWIKRAFGQLLSLLRYKNVHIIISSRPIMFLKEENNIPAGSPVFKILEFDDSQIERWLDSWRSIPENRGSDINFEDLKERKLLSIVKNPLLLYMTAKIFDTELLEERVYSKGIIYQLFYDWTIRGKFKADKQAHKVPENYRSILQNIAMVMRSLGSNNEYIHYKDLKKRIIEFQKELPDEDLFKMNEQILTAHFFKVKEKAKLTFIEFAHKSFKEYLIAEKIFSFFQESISKKVIDEVKWLSLGRMLPEEEEFRFLQDLLYTLTDEEMAWLYGEIISGKLHMLISSGSFRRVLEKTNFPNESEIGTIYYRSINLSCLAYIVSNMIYSKLRTKLEELSEIYSKIKTASPAKKNSTKYVFHICNSTPGTHLKDTKYFKNWLTAKKFMNGIDLSTLTLDGIDLSLAELDEANFSKASLKRCSFENANSVLADFSHAKCDGADFSGSFCANNIFSGARLHQVTFRNAEIYFGKFENGKLVNVDFSGTRIENCDFTGSRWKNVIYNPEKMKNCKGLPKEIEDSIRKQH